MKLLFAAICTAVGIMMHAPARSVPRALPITIYRDKYGIPSIQGSSQQDSEYGLGYATAMDNAVQMERNFKQARGRLGELDGEGALLQDGFLRSLGLEERAQQEAGNLTGLVALDIDAFCAGANSAILHQKAKLPAWITPITRTDVLALAQLVNCAFALEDIAGKLLPVRGSNQFALAPARTATHNALLSADPHLPWDGILAWYEFAIYSPGLAFHGITIPGLPFGVMGHSNYVAWCMTNNDPMLYTFYTVKLMPGDRTRYSYHGQYRPFDHKEYTLRYLKDGKLLERPFRAQLTKWGPMLPFRSQAVALTMLGDWQLLGEVNAMAHAQNAAQFRAALAPCGIAMWNIVYADTTGKIGYQYNAHIPHRDPHYNWSDVVPGDVPQTAWGAPYSTDELPHALQPASGILVNCNSAPWLTTMGSEIPKAWPADVTTYTETTRHARLAKLLATSHGITITDAEQIATDTQVPYALQVVAQLAAAALQNPTMGDADALAILKRWDGRANTDSTGLPVYTFWLAMDKTMSTLAARAGSGTAWSAEEQKSALTALAAAAKALITDFGALHIPWGKMHYAKRGALKVPMPGFDWGSMAAVVPNTGNMQKGNIQCTVGSSFRMIAELSPKGIRSWTILPYGDSQDPANPHYADQLKLFAALKYKDTYFGIDRIKKAAASVVTIERH